MNLPNHDQAIVSPEKLSDYLLSRTHPVGRFKAAFFRALGFDESNMELLTQGLLAIAGGGEAHVTIATDFGTKYVIAGNLIGPSGRTARVQTVWIVDREQTAPRFVTAYPLEAEE